MQADLVNQSIHAREVSFSPKTVSIWTVLRETMVIDIKTAFRYKAGLIGTAIALIARMFFFFVWASVITFEPELLGREMTNTDVAVFFQGSLILWIFRGIAITSPLRAVESDLYFGTLEYLFTNPFSRYAYYVGAVFSQVLITQIVFLPLYIVLIVISEASLVNMLMVLVVCGVVFITLTAMGVMVAGLGLLWRNIGSITGILDLAFEFLAGAFFPIAAFPVFLQYVAYTLPFTWGYDLVRYYSFNREWNTILPVWQEWAFLIFYIFFYGILSIYFLNRVEKLAKRKGLNLL